MTTTHAPAATRSPLDRRIVLSALWISVLFVFAYVDLFAFWRADVIQGALAGEVPGAGFTINQAFLTLTTVYILVPSLMVAASVLLPRRINRIANLVLPVLLGLTIVASMVGKSWWCFLIGSVVELALLAGIVITAARWR